MDNSPTIAAQIEARFFGILMTEADCVNQGDKRWFNEADIRAAIVTALRQAEAAPGVVEALLSRLDEALADPRDNRSSRHYLGRRVREVWVKWAEKQDNCKPSWLLPYDDLSEPDQEVDRQIGETLANIGVQAWLNANRFLLRDIREALARQHGAREDALIEALSGLELTEDGYSLRTPYDGDADDQGRSIVVGGDVVMTFADSDAGEAAREAVLSAIGLAL